MKNYQILIFQKGIFQIASRKKAKIYTKRNWDEPKYLLTKLQNKGPGPHPQILGSTKILENICNWRQKEYTFFNGVQPFLTGLKVSYEIKIFDFLHKKSNIWNLATNKKVKVILTKGRGDLPRLLNSFAPIKEFSEPWERFIFLRFWQITQFSLNLLPIMKDLFHLY